MAVGGHPPIPHPGILDCYLIDQDWMGPLYFAPDQCLRQTSFTHPNKASPIIAMVKNNSTKLGDDVLQYWSELTKIIKHKVSIALAPNFKTKVFNSEEELYEYVTDPDYMISKHYPGICFGFGIEENSPNKFTSKLYFNDYSRKLGARFANGIPDQKLDVYEPFR